MTREEKDNSNGTPGVASKPGSSKRPSRTIELEAKAVEIEVKPDGDEPAGEEGPDEESVATESPDQAGDQPSPPTSEPRPQRTRPSEVKSFVTHLAAGLLGGLIGVIGAGIGLDKLPLAGLMGDSGAGEQIAQVEQRLNALDGKLAGQSKSLEGVAQSEALDALVERLAAVENKPETATLVPQDFTDRLGKLEETLKMLVSSAGEEGASGLGLSAALTAKIEGVSSELEKRAGALKDDIAGLKNSLQERDASQALDSGPALSALDARLGALEEKITELAARPQAPAQQTLATRGPDSEGARLVLAFESLRRGVESGKAFKQQLEALAKLAPEGLDLSALAKHAGTGVVTERYLLSALPPVLRDARAAATKSDDDMFLGRLASNAQSVVRVRRIGPLEGKSAKAVLSRIEVHMKAANLNGVLNEAKALSGPALDTVQPWFDRARARQASMAGLEVLEKDILAILKPGADAQK